MNPKRGRIYRTGQKRKTTIYRLFSTGTLEEVIYQRQLQKGALASVTVDGREEGTAKFSSEELKECMTLRNTQCDTKDKMGESWGDFDGSIVSGDSSVDDVVAQLAESGLLTFAHVVDEETAPKRSGEESQATPGRGDHYESDTSEEEFDYEAESPFDKTMHKKRVSNNAVVNDTSDSDEEAEFM